MGNGESKDVAMQKNKLYLFIILISALALIIPACSGDSSNGGGGGGGGGGGLPDGIFIKTAQLDSNTVWDGHFDSSITDLRVQHLYFADWIGGSGYITAIAFKSNTTTAAEITCPDLTLKMGHTSFSALTNMFAMNVEQGKGSVETVLTNAQVVVPVVSAGDYFEIQLDTPFYYNGVDNLVVEFIRTGVCDGTISLLSDNTVSNCALWSDNLASATGTLERPLNMEFYFEGGENTMNYGGASGNYWPFSSDLPRTQNLYLASEINGSGPITGIAFQAGSTTSTETYTATVKLAHSTQTSLSTIWAFNYAGSPKTVANEVTFTIPAGIPAGEYFWVPLPDGTFTYDGTRNLLVEVDISAGSGVTNLRCSDIADRRTPGYHSDGVNAKGGGVDDVLPHIKLRFNGGTMDVITVEDGVWTVPFSSVDNNKTQILFGAQQFGTGGPVTGISFRLWLDSVASYYPLATVVLGHNANTALSPIFDLNMADPTTVFTGTIIVPGGLKAGDWVNIPVSGFTYYPAWNLVIEVVQNVGVFPNFILATNDDVPGASGVLTGERSSPVATVAFPGQCDIRIHLSK
jgi:hypothetical protein